MSSGSSPVEAPRSPGLAGAAVVPDLILAPRRAFERLAAAPRWIGPMIVGLVLVTVAAWVALPVTLDFSYESAAATLERMGVPEVDRVEALARMPDADDRSPRVLAQHVGGGMVGAAVFAFVGALLLHGIARAAGLAPARRATLALFFGAYVVSALGALVKASLMAAAGTIEVTLGPGALLPDLAYHSVPAILLDLFDVFSLWNLALLGIGAQGMWRVARGTAFGICGTYWILKAVGVAGSRAFASWMLGAL